ncbi:MAG: GatB/YqeY domain-containing protein [Methylophilaceae bacterium]
MSLKEKINEDMKSAMRSKDVALLGAIRLIQAAIKQKEVDERILVDDSSVISIIEKMLKQRNDSIEAFKKANRIDLVDKEEFEVSVLKNYMPEQMNAEEVEKIIQEVIKKIGASSMKEMGPVMAQAKEILSGKANMAEVSKIIKAKLSS